MSSQYRELIARLGSYLGDNDFDSSISIDNAADLMNLMKSKTIPVEEDPDGSKETNNVRALRRRDALRRACNAVLRGAAEGDPDVDVGLLNQELERIAWKFLVGAVARDKGVRAILEAEWLRTAIDSHYATARPELCDIFVHLSASEMFFIDGDSLFMAAISPYNVDWDLVQPLHVMYNAQKLLYDLKCRGARFHVVFFDSMLWIWEKAPAKLFMRGNLRLALQAATKSNGWADFFVCSFPSYHSEEFSAYLRKWEPEFILMTDGEQLGSLNKLQALFAGDAVDEASVDALDESRDTSSDEDNGVDPPLPPPQRRPYRSMVEDEALGDAAATYIRCMLLWASSQRLMVVYSSRIIYKENAVIAFAVPVDDTCFERALEIGPEVQALAQSMERDVELVQLFEGCEAILSEEIPYREKIIFMSLQSYLKAAPRTAQEEQLCQALVLSAYATALLGCDLRAQCVLPNATLQRFVTDLSPFLLSALRLAGCDGAEGSEFDIVDFHLLYAIVGILRTTAMTELLDEDGVHDVNSIWCDITCESNLDITTTPRSSLPEVMMKEGPKPRKYVRYKHDLVEHLARVFQVEGCEANSDFPDDIGAARRLIDWDISVTFDKLNDVIDADGELEARRRMTEKDLKKEQEWQNKFVRNAFQQAQSMGISGFASEAVALVVSDNEKEGTAHGGDGAKGEARAAKKKAGVVHEGQRNQKGLGKDEMIRENKNILTATQNVKNWLKDMEKHLSNMEAFQSLASDTDRQEAVKKTLAALRRLKESNISKCFDPGQALGETENNSQRLKVVIWRLLVGASHMREVEFALTCTVASKNTAKKDNKRLGEVLHGFDVIDSVVKGWEEGCTASREFLTHIHRAHPGMAHHEAAAYLRWVYLSYVELHIQMKLKCRVVKLYLENWRRERETARLSGREPKLAIGIPLFLYCHHEVLSVITNECLQISPEDLNTVRSALVHFDFEESYYKKLDDAIALWQNKPVDRLSPSLYPRTKMLDITPEQLQLIHMGHLLERPCIRRRDYRVAFNPDDWQRELLDIVDSRGSAVVCAPTSAGKTFISYYCMYNTLRRSNKRIVVYLAPARALINQAVADVCARYGSKEYKNTGKYIYGVLGGADYHQYHDSCQVLLTVPETFETMLLSPKYAEWVDLIDYVILDEIHSMEYNGNGDVWERILALLPCPFIALSATLGETQQLCGWLNRVQGCLKKQVEKEPSKSRDFNVHVLPREGKTIQRWNDIKKYIYLPRPGAPVSLKKLTSGYEERFIHDLHPLSILTTDQFSRGFPPDLSLVPSESVSLFEKMRAVFDEMVMPRWSALQLVRRISASLDQLRPDIYFQKETYITQNHARQYERDNKNTFAFWVLLGNGGGGPQLSDISAEERADFCATMKSAAEAILSAFAHKLNEDEAALEKYAVEAMEAKRAQEQDGAADGRETTAKLSGKISSFPGSRQYIRAHMLNVLRELCVRDMGPTIVFSFESEDCEDLVKFVVERLEEAEESYRRTDEFAAYKARMERNAAAQEQKRKQRESTMKQKRLKTNEDGDVERNEREVSDDDADEEVFVVPEVLPEFTFVCGESVVEPSVLEAFLKDCEKEGESLLLRALRRGIGMHHAGVKGKLRGHVETLFRRRHCGVIFSTETLALGIHSPCRSVVLAGDHMLLNSTQFRQMMGRAGRRGLDFLGHLIFFGISLKRIKRLMTSGMTVIKGNVQMDPMAQLRLLQLHDGSNQKPVRNAEALKRHVLNMAERLYVEPLFFQRRRGIEKTNMEGFTIKYLQMMLFFLQKEGLHFHNRSSSLGSLLQNALYVFRDANVGNEGFAFIRMLTSGVFRRARYPPAHEKSLQSGVMDEPVAELLAYLFSLNKMCGVHLETHRCVLLDPAVGAVWESRTGATNHRVVLAPAHLCSPRVRPFDNRDFFALLSAFYHELGQGMGKPEGVDLRLPYMNANLKPIIFGTECELPLADKLRATAVPYAARSPFVAICGCGDEFTTIEDVVLTLRNGLFCDRRLLPIVDIVDGWRHDGAQFLVNACVADFLRVKAQFDSTRKNYRFTMLEEVNGLSQSLSYAVLNRVEKILSNLAGLVRADDLPRAQVLTAIMPREHTDDSKCMAGAQRVLQLAEHINSLQSQIRKQYSAEKHAARKAKWLSEISAKQT
uniref:Putative ATP-dependent DEAD/H RNA helicase n=1 Tax=Trypanosoma vivax (strain Y486) TaxID=1055687 RepID=G0TSS4_TRYVY|nr:putative ATP-dependent DEAD/H RNA helicase [Trypanosoma vivax Y486]